GTLVHGGLLLLPNPILQSGEECRHSILNNLQDIAGRGCPRYKKGRGRGDRWCDQRGSTWFGCHLRAGETLARHGWTKRNSKFCWGARRKESAERGFHHNEWFQKHRYRVCKRCSSESDID